MKHFQELDYQTTHLRSRFEDTSIRPKKGDEFDETRKMGRVNDQKKARNRLKEQGFQLAGFKFATLAVSERVESILDDRNVEEVEREEGKGDTPMSLTPEKK